MIRFHIISLFPTIFESPFDYSILKRAKEKGLLAVHIYNLRDYAEGKHKVTDDYPFGGGRGMILKVEPIIKALDDIKKSYTNTYTILLTPQGEKFTQQKAFELSKKNDIILICGHYEGIDERVRYFVDKEISIGDYILTGGEIAAMVIVDSVTRLVPGAITEDPNAYEDTFSDGLLEYPQYTRPRCFRGINVPEVLLSGDHARIKTWRRQQSLIRTYERRPELLSSANLSKEDKEFLEKIKKVRSKDECHG